ncbi:MAG: hypothetical protein EOL86_01975 [Deltaproteobacteria bacterium]|nr:hypothetical protein [Deltaproteobacteria bacterium]
MIRIRLFQQRARWMLFCFSLSTLLHAAPVWFLLFGPVHDPAKPLEIDLNAFNSYRERVFRELSRNAHPEEPLPPVQLAVMTQTRPERKVRLSAPLEEEDLTRVRVIQRAILGLWTRMYCPEAGSALVRLNILEDGRIGGYAVTRLNGNAEFKAFLASFLTTFQASYADQAGPGRMMNLECEFVVKPNAASRGRS